MRKSDHTASAYERLGVSHKKEDVHKALTKVDQGIFPTAFCKIIEDITGDPAYCSIMHADAVGTKCTVAYMMYKETGDLKYFQGLVHDAVVMNTDDLLCIGAIEPMFLSNTIERNAKLIHGETISTVIAEYEAFTKKLTQLGLPVKTCGGETGDVGDLIRTLTLGATIMTRMRRSDVIIPDKIQNKDMIVGLSSCGKASYEDDLEYNSGIGSNGLTLARHGVLCHDYYKTCPECFGPEIPEANIFYGQHRLLDKLAGTPLTIGEAILSPTRTYAPIIVKLLQQNRAAIHAIYHNTGGGQAKCLKFGDSVHYIKDNLFPIPPFFKCIQESSKTSWEEMYQVFNMGHRMEILCPENVAKDILIPISRSFSVDAQIVGHIEKLPTGTPNQLTLDSPMGNFKFTAN